jgi:EmrB/QacA subfamily drug resistance transporter
MRLKEIDKRWFQHLILLSAPLLTVIDVFIVNVAIPSIKKGLGATNGEIQLIIAMYLLGYASFQIVGGRAGDHFGRKKVFFMGMLFFTITSCFCGLATTASELIIARFFQGVSGAFMLPQALSYVQILFPLPNERTKAIGLIGFTMGVASILGQFLGGYLSGVYFIVEGWRLIFFINLPVGLIALAATAKYLHESEKNRSGKFDYPGVGILTSGLMSLIYPLIIGREKGWPLWSVCLLTSSLLIFAYFIYNQKKKLAENRSYLINMQLFRIKDFNIGIMLVAFYFMMHTSYLLICTVYFQNGLHISAYQSGLYFVFFGIFFTLSSLLSIRLVNTFGKRALQAGPPIVIVTFIIQSILFLPGIKPSYIYVLMSFYGLGGGLVLPSLINMALKSVPHHFAGAAAGVYNTCQQVASSLGISIIGGVFYSVLGSDNTGSSYHKAFCYGLTLEIFCLIVVIVLLYLLPDIKSKKMEASIATH